MELFLAVTEAGGLAAGGRKLGLSPASVTARIAALEQEHRVRLLNRTTRSIALTEEGRIYADAARSILAELDELGLRLATGRETLSGHLRIAAPFDLGRNRLTPLIDRFLANHPCITVELLLSDGLTDLVGQRIDCALRYGNLSDSGLKSRRLGANRRIVCASPDYLTQYGTPATPEDLAAHNCLLMYFGDRLDNRWRFECDGKPIMLTVNGNRRSNDGEVIRRWAMQGFGVAFKSAWDVQDDLHNGRLVELLSPYCGSANSLQIVYPDGQSLPGRTRAFIDAVIEEFAGAAPQTGRR